MDIVGHIQENREFLADESVYPCLTKLQWDSIIAPLRYALIHEHSTNWCSYLEKSYSEKNDLRHRTYKFPIKSACQSCILRISNFCTATQFSRYFFPSGMTSRPNWFSVYKLVKIPMRSICTLENIATILGILLIHCGFTK